MPQSMSSYLTPSHNTDIVFTFSLSSPPLLAGAPLTVDANYEQVAISFQVARTNASRLLAILEDRGIVRHILDLLFATHVGE